MDDAAVKGASGAGRKYVQYPGVGENPYPGEQDKKTQRDPGLAPFILADPAVQVSAVG